MNISGSYGGYGGFSPLLKASRDEDKDKAATPGDIIQSSSTGYPEDKKKTDNAAVAYIQEHGFMAYLKEKQQQKMEELRAKIMDSMGIDENDLANMSPTQRSQVEKTISDAIKQQMSEDTLASTAGKKKNESTSERNERQRAEMLFDPQMFAVLTALQIKDQELSNTGAGNDPNKPGQQNQQGSVFDNANIDGATTGAQGAASAGFQVRPHL